MIENKSDAPRFDLDEAVAALERTPAALTSLLAGLPEPWLTARDNGDTWNAREIVVHLVHGEQTDWIPRARIILAQGASIRFQPFDRTANFAAAGTLPMVALLKDFAARRAASLATLLDWRITPAQLRLQGEHPELGRVTLEQLLATWVAHDYTHLSQITRTMARRYRTDVGPWRAYFKTLK
jgi:hypothetical protein